jgi:hypothetical protein
MESILFELGLIGGSGAYIFVYWFRSSRQWIRRKLAKLPRTPIANLQEGELARIVGRVRKLDHTVLAPVSGVHCVYYHVVVDMRSGGGWKRVIDQPRGMPFILEDDSGFIYIDANRAQLTTQQVRFYPALHPDPVFDQFLHVNGVNPLAKNLLRVHEMRIEVDQTFCVLGAGVADVDPKAALPETYRGDRATRLRFAGAKKYPLVISDDPSLH